MSEIQDNNTSTYKITKLTGEGDYARWALSIKAILLAKDLTDYINTNVTSTDVTEIKKRNLTFSIIIQALSDDILANLSAAAADTDVPKPVVLWQELKANSAVSGARKAVLFQQLLKTRIPDQENPLQAMGQIKSAHPQINASGSIISDEMLAYTIALALPESYAPIKQSLWQISPMKSSKVIAAIQNEYNRLQAEQQFASTDTNSTALVSRNTSSNTYHNNSKHNYNFNRTSNNTFNRPARDPNAYCDEHQVYGHSTENCFLRKRKERNSSTNNRSTAMEAFAFNASVQDITTRLEKTSISSTAQFVIDSGATHHMVNNIELLHNVRNCAAVPVTFGDGSRLLSTTQGSITIGNIELHDVLYVPGLQHNLISVNKTPGVWIFAHNIAKLQSSNNEVQLEAKSTSNGLYMVTNTPIALSATTELLEWHKRLGHTSPTQILSLHRQGLLPKGTTISSNDVNNFQCEWCILGKGTRLPSPESPTRATRPLAIIHTDLWGPARTPSNSGAVYMLVCYDDMSRKIHLAFLKKKSEATQAIIKYIAQSERQLNIQTLQIRSDLGGEFNNNTLSSFCGKFGIQQATVPPDAHAQNGRVERVNLTILNGVRTLLAQTGLPHSFWAEAAAYIAYCRNISPSGKENIIPEREWRKYTTQNRFCYSKLYPFGTKLYFRDHKNTNKLQPRYKTGLLLGYNIGTAGYRILDFEHFLSNKIQVTISRDVVFSKNNILVQPATPNAGDNSTTLFNIGDIEEHNNNEIQDNIQAEDNSNKDSDTQSESSHESRDPLDCISEDSCNLAAAYIAGNDKTPQTYSQARNSIEGEKWTAAIEDELSKMRKYNVFEVVPRQEAKGHTVPGKWVFTRKIDGETGKPSTYKARWVAKGFKQIAGLDYNELFASVAHKDSIRTFLAIVNYLNLELHQVDIKAAFLNGDLDETIYMEPPEGLQVDQNHIIRLKKSLYGLKQAPRCFNQKLDAWLKKQGLKPTKSDACIYYRNHNGKILIISIHVDDQLLACNDTNHLLEFKILLNKEFECSDSGNANYFLGFNIQRDRTKGELRISQHHYINSILSKFKMEDCNPANTPFPAGFKAIAATNAEFEEAQDLQYPQLAGSLLYLATISRPDIAQAATTLCRYIGKWNKAHYAAAKHMLRYLKGTINLSLTFRTKRPTIDRLQRRRLGRRSRH
jgi:hypothetical protein